MATGITSDKNKKYNLITLHGKTGRIISCSYFQANCDITTSRFGNSISELVPETFRVDQIVPLMNGGGVNDEGGAARFHSVCYKAEPIKIHLYC